MYNSPGYWLFHRKIWENPLFRGHPNRIVVWAWMLSEAQWESGRKVMLGSETITLLPGQFTCGSKQIAQITGVPRGTVERIRKLFKSEELIEERTDHQKTLITVKKWNEYQKLEERFEERVRNDRGTSEDTVIKELKELKEKSPSEMASAVQKPVKEKKGKDEYVESVLASFQEIMGIDNWSDSVATRRRYAKLLQTSRRWSVEQVNALLKVAKVHPYHMKWCKMSDVYYKGVELIREYKQKIDNPSIAVIS